MRRSPVPTNEQTELPVAGGDLLVRLTHLTASGPGDVLERCVTLIADHPRIDYVGLDLSAPLGGPAGRVIEREAPVARSSHGDVSPPRPHPSSAEPCKTEPRTQVWRCGAETLPQPLAARGLIAAARFPIGAPCVGTLTAGGRQAEVTDATTLDFCEAAAAVVAGVVDRLQLEQQLLHLQRVQLVGELTSAIVHDFSNVLTGVVGFCAIARSQLPDGHPARHNIEMIDSLGASGVDLTQQLLGFVRRGGESARLIDVRSLAEQVTRLCSSATPSGVRVECECEGALPAVSGERSLLEQALANLVINAANAMPRGGTVRVHVRHTASAGVAIDVTDSGTGIPADVLPHIFEPFFTTRGADGGTGLGLTSVQRIARRHGGRVDVVSEAGRGTTFTLELPAAGRPQPAHREDEDPYSQDERQAAAA